MKVGADNGHQLSRDGHSGVKFNYGAAVDYPRPAALMSTRGTIWCCLCRPVPVAYCSRAGVVPGLRVCVWGGGTRVDTLDTWQVFVVAQSRQAHN